MNATTQLLNYQLGLLHFAHLLVNEEGRIGEREKKVLRRLQEEEQISQWVFDDFLEHVYLKSEREIFEQGIRLLNQCSEEEKVTAFAHLYCLAEGNNEIRIREVQLLFHSLNVSESEFQDVELAARMAKVAKSCA